MATEGRILTAADVSGGNPVRTVVLSTQANDEVATSLKDQQVLSLGDPTTAANLAAVDAAGRLNITAADAVASGTITAADAVVAAPGGAGALVSGASTAGSLVALALAGDSDLALTLTGTLSGNYYVEASVDSTNGTDGNWIQINVRQTGVLNTVLVNTVTAAGYYRGNVAGAKYVRVRNVGGTSPNTTVTLRAGLAPGALFLNASIPAGSNIIGGTRPQAAVAGVDTQVTGVAGNVANRGAALDVNLAASASNLAQTSGTLTAVGSTVVASVGNQGNGTIVLLGGTYTALTLAFEGTLDGTNWFPIDVVRSDGTAVINGAYGEQFTAAGVRAWNFMAPGYTQVRVRAVAITQTVAPSIYFAQGPFLYDPSPTIAPVDGNKPTYSASVTGLASNIAGDVMVLTGSATKLVRVVHVDATCTMGGTVTAAGIPVRILKRTTADTAGTAGTAPTVATFDSIDSAATATSTSYTAAPTAGTAGPTIRAARWQAAATSFNMNFDTANNPAKAPVLRGTAQQLVINQGAAVAGTSPTATWDIVIVWTEE